MDKLGEKLKDWASTVETDQAATSSGIPVKVLYTPKDMANMDYLNDLGVPGEYPFTRGIYPTMHRGRLWTMRQYSGFGTAEESNQRYKFLLGQGQTGLSVALDLPTQIGYDSDDPMVEEEVGRVGVSIDTLLDMEILFDGIPLDKISTSFTINSTASVLLAMYIAVAEKQGIDSAQVRGTIQNDILKEYVARGTWIFPPEPSIRLIVDTIEWCMNNAPKFNPISIAGAHFRDAGATAVQELAFTLADAISYVEAALARGIDIDEFAPLLSFFFYTHNDFFEEVAKYRAGRRIWAKLMKERFGAVKPKSQMFRFGVVGGGSTLTAQQPLNNVVRVAYQALSSVLGGVQSMFTCAWDEAYDIPTVESAELALRTQQVLGYETRVMNTVDPLAGSYFVESLTDEMESAVMKIITEIEDKGGMVKAVQSGHIQSEILKNSYQHQKQVESGELVIVGVNKFVKDESDPTFQLYEANRENFSKQVDRLKQVKMERNAGQVAKTLANLQQAAKGQENLMPYLVEAVKAYATIGEIIGILKEEFGEFQEPAVI
ncbi:methylmalonyl-CoA mutase family protein [Metallumcola ferriviriculae]|uniref:Methylmalonyl-CoA mutase family protein n=1 Tax=Metallumcola ferriviriculae TaxID=3039180 RepID=A0AAU0URH7_9FIRM|nr:methylmalonyl-CoA mutase family protein [Desulfitibacteraceae bacterium MK1]